MKNKNNNKSKNNNIDNPFNIIEFKSIISDLIENKSVLKMKNFYHHSNTTCYEHCIHVAYCNYIIAKKLNLDYVAATRGGLLHDLFLYDWKAPKNGRKGFHCFTHPKAALNNALKEFTLSDLEKDIILKHMWPTTLILPSHAESYICTLTDKYCAIIELFNGYLENHNIVKNIKSSHIKNLDRIYNFIAL